MNEKKNLISKKKAYLIDKLKEENAFWSYQGRDISELTLSDQDLITMTLRYLDLKEIDILFTLFSYNRIKYVWKQKLVPEGDYLYTLNRFLAWYYFKSKRPDQYLNSLETRYYNKLCAS